MCSIWFVVLVGLNRYWAVCHPHAMSTVWSLPRTLLYIALVLIFVVSFNTPRFFEYSVITENYTSQMTYNTDVITNLTLLQVEDSVAKTRLVELTTEFGSSYSYRVVYKSFLVVIVLIVVPLVLLSILTINITHTLRKQSRRKQVNGAMNSSTTTRPVPASAPSTLKAHPPLTMKLSATPTKKHNPQPTSSTEITTLLILVVIVAIVANIPLCIFHFVRLADSYGCGYAVFYLDSVSKLLVNINSMANFLLYCCFSPRFRNIIIDRVLMMVSSTRCTCRSRDPELDCPVEQV